MKPCEKRLNFDVTKAITLNAPGNLDINDKQLAMLVASQLYEKRKLSLGQAAELAGLAKRAFAELVGSYHVSIFNFLSSYISRDVVNA